MLLINSCTYSLRSSFIINKSTQWKSGTIRMIRVKDQFYNGKCKEMKRTHDFPLIKIGPFHSFHFFCLHFSRVFTCKNVKQTKGNGEECEPHLFPFNINKCGSCFNSLLLWYILINESCIFTSISFH